MKSGRLATGLLAVSVLLGGAGGAAAEPVTYEFTGLITSASTVVPLPFRTPFSGSFTYDTGAIPVGDAARAEFEGLLSFEIDFGLFSAGYAALPGGAAAIAILNTPGSDAFVTGMNAAGGLSSTPFGDYRLERAILTLADSTGAAFDTALRLPGLLDLSAFDFRAFWSFSFIGPRDEVLVGALGSLERVAQVPEPGTLALVLLAAGAAARIRARTPRVTAARAPSRQRSG